MKICFVSESPLPWGGTSAREIEFMQALVQGGHDVHAIFNSISEEGKALRKMEGVKVHNHRSKLFKKSDDNLEILSGALNIQYYFKKINELKDEMDVFHFSNHSRAFLGTYYKEILDIPTVASLHNSVSPDFPGFMKTRFYIAKEFKERFIAPHHNAIIITTELGKNNFLRKYLKKLKSKCFVIPNPIDWDEIKDFKDNSKPINERKKLIGRFTKRGSEDTGIFKNVRKNEDLLSIINKVKKYHPDAEVLLIGKKPPKERRIKDSSVKYTGYVDDLDDVLSQLQMGIVTGRKWTGGGFRSRATEFIKRGVPVLGYPPQAIRPSWGFAEKNGGIILKDKPEKIAEEIIGVLDNKDKLKKMSMSCYKSSKKLSYDNICSMLENSYQYAIKNFKE